MKKYLQNYIIESKTKLKSKINSNDIDNHLNKISFFQHERLIHLMVTLFCILMLLIFIILAFYNVYFLIIDFILLIIVIFYVLHYFYLENGVQELYKIYDEMINKI